MPTAGVLEKPRSKAQLFRRFCAWGTRRGFFTARENRSPALGLHPEPAAGVRGWAKIQTRCVNCSPQVCPAQPRVRARRGEEKDTVRELPAAGALEKPRSRAQLFKRFCAWGMRRGFHPATRDSSSVRACTQNQPRACETGRSHKHGARLARRRRGLFPCPGKQKLSVGPHPEPAAGVCGSNADTNTVRDLPGAAARACETRGGKRHGA